MLGGMISPSFLCLSLHFSTNLYFSARLHLHCKEKQLSLVFYCVRGTNVNPNWINGITYIALKNAPPPPPRPPRHPIAVLAAFFSLLCSLIFQQLQGQSNGPFKLPASCICKKEIMSSSSVGKCSSTEVPSRVSTADVFPLKSRHSIRSVCLGMRCESTHE